MTSESHKLGEVLRAAREAKGVDLARVERETKIRERYLSALERGEYRELPGAVYTKGFLRNYGSYLGLDPEYLIDLYRLETSATTAERSRTPAPPRPLAVRRRRTFIITPGAVVAALLTIGVGALVAYIGYELVTFARTPELLITEPGRERQRASGARDHHPRRHRPERQGDDHRPSGEPDGPGRRGWEIRCHGRAPPRLQRHRDRGPRPGDATGSEPGATHGRRRHRRRREPVAGSRAARPGTADGRCHLHRSGRPGRNGRARIGAPGHRRARKPGDPDLHHHRPGRHPRVDTPARSAGAGSAGAHSRRCGRIQWRAEPRGRNVGCDRHPEGGEPLTRRVIVVPARTARYAGASREATRTSKSNRTGIPSRVCPAASPPMAIGSRLRPMTRFASARAMRVR